jgi:hypothetical protein
LREDLDAETPRHREFEIRKTSEGLEESLGEDLDAEDLK